MDEKEKQAQNVEQKNKEAQNAEQKDKQADSIEKKDKRPNVAAGGGAEKDSRDGIVSFSASFREEIARIVRGEDSDASLILGPHWVEREGQRVLVVRAFRPGATEASLLWRGNPEPQTMTEIHPGGVFEAIAPSRAAGSGGESAATLREATESPIVAGSSESKSASTTTASVPGGVGAIPPTEYRVQFRFVEGNTWEGYD